MKLEEAPKAYEMFDRKEDVTKVIFKPWTYLGDDIDSSETLEFLWLAVGEVTHYEVLNALSKKFKNKKLFRRSLFTEKGEETYSTLHKIG